MKTYVFRVVVEPDEDRWHAYCPALEKYGAATWGNTMEEAFKHIKEVVEIIVNELSEDKEPIPEELKDYAHISKDWKDALDVIIEQYGPALRKLAE